MTLGTVQKTTYKGNRLWSWSVHLVGAASELDNVDHVVYHLHPTYREPELTAMDRATSFEISAVGWGSFQIQIEVGMKDESTVDLVHELDLKVPDGEEPVAERGGVAGQRGALPEERRGPAGGNRATPEGPLVFLSHSASDDVDLDELRKDLKLEGIEVVGEDHLDPGRSLQLQINELKDRSDAVIGVVSGPRMSRVVSNDLSDAVRIGKPVMIFNIGDEISGNMSELLQSGELNSSQILLGSDSKVLAGQINTNIRASARTGRFRPG